MVTAEGNADAQSNCTVGGVIANRAGQPGWLRSQQVPEDGCRNDT